MRAFKAELKGGVLRSGTAFTSRTAAQLFVVQSDTLGVFKPTRFCIMAALEVVHTANTGETSTCEN
jgi:hypothetical protein